MVCVQIKLMIQFSEIAMRVKYIYIYLYVITNS